tara:strand:+ start:2892 stop:3584 length:693 start_codon:yes stop_codon:yes gene_type:complete
MNNYLVIGGSSGIGKALTENLLINGHNVFATYNNNILENKNNLSVHHLNVENDFDLEFLPDRLDGIVYCPGLISLKPFRRLNIEDLTRDLNIQVFGLVKVIQKAYSNLRKSQDASIVAFSTVAVQKGFNFHSQVAISKGAIEGLIRSLAAEFAPKIRVNAIAPSLTDTPLASDLINSEEKRASNAEKHPLKRLGTAEDIANTASFLLSSESSWMTGQVLSVDGGMSSIKS